MDRARLILCILIVVAIGYFVYTSSSTEEFGWGRRGWWRGPGWRGPRWWGRPDCYCGPYGCNCGYSVGRRGWFW